MNYKIGDTVVRKTNDGNKKIYDNRYIFLGITDNNSIKPVVTTKEVMGEDVQIGMFVHKPVEVIYNDDNCEYVVEVLFHNVELFEKDEGE